MKRHWILASLCLLVLAACSAKKPVALSGPSLFDQICGLESDRHGLKDFGSEHTHFDNEFMDSYRAHPGAPGVLLANFRSHTGVCRGALLQLLFEVHQTYVVENYASLDRELSPEERVFFIRLLGRYKHPGFPAIIVSYLSAEQDRVRAIAASKMNGLDQTHFLKELKSCARSEAVPKVLEELAMALNLDKYPETQEVLQILAGRHMGEVERAVLTQWSTSSLPNNKVLIETMADSSDPETAGMAKHLLTMLGKKDHLTLLTKIETTQIEPLEVDPELQEALSDAIYSDDIAAIEKLLNQGAQLNSEDARSHSPFHSALNSNPATLKFCIEKGGLMDPGPGKFNPLMELARSSYKNVPENVGILIEAGIDPNAVTEEGESALFFACLSNRTNIVKALIERGADPNHRDNLGRRPLDIARLLENEDLIKLLEGITSP